MLCQRDLVICLHSMSNVFTVKPVNIYVMVYSFRVKLQNDWGFRWAAGRAPNMWENVQICYLGNRVATGRSFDGSSAALGLIVRSVVGFGLHFYLQFILAKLARQRPVQRRQ